MNWRRIPLGPPLFLPLVDEEIMLSRWRDQHPVAPSTSSLHAAHQGRERGSSRLGRWRRLSRRRHSPR
jgi:hypothetical protein